MAPADHLVVPRQHGIFQHHGIDLGDGTIVHYLEGKQILRSSYKEFSRGELVKIAFHKSSSSVGTTLRRAMSRVGEQRYNLLFNNCEHFANWCKTGKHRSAQMESFLKKTTIGSLALGQIVPAAIFTGLNFVIKNDFFDQSSRKVLLNRLSKLKKLKNKLMHNLDLVLQQIDSTNHTNSSGRYKNDNSSVNNLLLQAQLLADKMEALEELEEGFSPLLDNAEQSHIHFRKD